MYNCLFLMTVLEKQCLWILYVFFSLGVQVHDLKASSRDWLTEEKQLSLTWNVLEADCSNSDLPAKTLENQIQLSPSFLSATVGEGVTQSQLTIPNTLWTAFVNAFVREDYKKLNKIRFVEATVAFFSFKLQKKLHFLKN